MDATRLRALIDGALAAQAAFVACKAASEEMRKEYERVTERHRAEVGNLRAALADGAAVYGDKLVRVGPGTETGQWVHVTPVVTVPVVAPPPAPLPEAKPPAPKAANPLSGGSVPDIKKAR